MNSDQTNTTIDCVGPVSEDFRKQDIDVTNVLNYHELWTEEIQIFSITWGKTTTSMRVKFINNFFYHEENVILVI